MTEIDDTQTGAVTAPPPPVPDLQHPAHVRTRPSKRPPRLVLPQVLVAWLGAFIGIGGLAFLVEHLHAIQLLVIGSFGASAVLLFASPSAPFAQPRNLIGGHVISALIGIACYRYLPDILVLQEAAAVATAIAAMMLTRTVHPPGGATALIAVIGSDYIHDLGWGYVFPVMIGAAVLLLVALFSNNLFRPGSYPERWD